MRHNIRVDFIEEKAGVQLPARFHYREILEGIEARGEERRHKFHAGMKVVVWGALYVEATINDTFSEALDQIVGNCTKEEFETIWGLVKRSYNQKKLETIASAFDLNSKRFQEAKSKLGQLTELRNRLVHYKEKPTPIELTFEDGTPHKENFKELLINAVKAEDVGPTADIVDELLEVDYDQRRKDILEMADWISSATEQEHPQEDQ